MISAKEYLQQAYRLDQRINSHIREKEELRSMATSLSSPRMKEDAVQTSKSGDPSFVKALEKMWEMEEQIDAEIDKLVDLKQQIHQVISMVEKIDAQMVLRYRYIHNYTWEQIGDKLLADRRTVIRWHDTALKQVMVPEKPIII